MESPDHTPQTQTAASAAHKCSNGKENDGPPSPVQREHDGLRKRPRDDECGARDAPPLLDAAQTDDASDALRARVAAPAKEPLPRVLGKIMERRGTERTERAAARAKAKGDDPNVDAYATASGARRGAGVGAACYEPPERPSSAGIPKYPKDFTKWGYYQYDVQVDQDIERLENIDIDDDSALEVGVKVANRVGELFFTHFKPMVPKKVTTRAGRAAALTVVAINKLANKAMRIDDLNEERTTEEGAHVEVLREIKKELEKLGAVANRQCSVEGPLKPFACAHTYGGHVGTGPANDTKVSPIGSLVRKFLIIGSYTGELSEIVEDGVDCSFGKRTMAHKKRKGLAGAAAGNFRSHAQDGVPLPPELKDPRDLRFAFEKYLGEGPLDEDTYCVIGKTGELLKAAVVQGDEMFFIFDTSGFDVSKCLVSNVVSSGKKAIAKDRARREASWEATLKKCKEEEPVLYNVYCALDQLGMMKAPNTRRTEYECLRLAWNVIWLWSTAGSPLADSFVAGFGNGKELLISGDAFRKIQKWDEDAPYARTLLDYAGVKTLSELVLVTGDSSTGVNIPWGRGFAGGARLVPKHRAMDDGYGGFKHKPKKAKVGTGNGPTRYVCHRCGHAWNPDPDAINQGSQKGKARCGTCDTWVKPPA